MHGREICACNKNSKRHIKQKLDISHVLMEVCIFMKLSCSLTIFLKLQQLTIHPSIFDIYPGLGHESSHLFQLIQVGITTFLRQFNWFLLMGRSSVSATSPFQITELVTLSLREGPTTFQRKLVSASFIRDLIFLVTTQSLWPYSIHITMDTAPIQLSVLCSTLSSFMNKIVRYLNCSPWDGNSSLH